MVKTKLIALLVCLALLTSCASIPTQIPETMKEACALYQNVKPDVLKARQYAVDNWNSIPPNVQETLLKLDGYLPALDRAGQAVCAISGSVNLGGGQSASAAVKDVQWDDVLSTVVKAATLASDLKKQGVI